MYLNLLEFTYAVKERETVEAWLSQADLGGVLISIMQYYDEILGVLASEQALGEARKKLQQQPAVTSYEEKRRVVYRVTTTTQADLAIRSFPLREDEEWYLGTQKTAYLCLQSDRLNDKQISWLTTSAQVAAWDCLFDLTPMLVGHLSNTVALVLAYNSRHTDR